MLYYPSSHGFSPPSAKEPHGDVGNIQSEKNEPTFDIGSIVAFIHSAKAIGLATEEVAALEGYLMNALSNIDIKKTSGMAVISLLDYMRKNMPIPKDMRPIVSACIDAAEYRVLGHSTWESANSLYLACMQCYLAMEDFPGAVGMWRKMDDPYMASQSITPLAAYALPRYQEQHVRNLYPELWAKYMASRTNFEGTLEQMNEGIIKNWEMYWYFGVVRVSKEGLDRTDIGEFGRFITRGLGDNTLSELVKLAQRFPDNLRLRQLVMTRFTYMDWQYRSQKRGLLLPKHWGEVQADGYKGEEPLLKQAVFGYLTALIDFQNAGMSASSSQVGHMRIEDITESPYRN